MLWCLRELDLSYERIDAGMAFGRNNEADYLAMNPNGRVPTLVDGDFVLWESNSVMRYLVLEYGQGSPLYPQPPKRRTSVDRWLDWTLSTLQPVDRPVFWALVRTPVEQRDMVAIQKDADAEAVQWRIVDAQLSTRRFVEGRGMGRDEAQHRGASISGVIANEVPADLELPIPLRGRVDVAPDAENRPSVVGAASRELRELLSRKWSRDDFERFAVARGFL